ncbi:hypothetical protein JMJ35_006836 [Cladonia borealis]|uniref:Uncharacterized protein n=1 Tax=Cladonia borealis TaxID=184061 RepID=A0AA39V3V2_9LECA|nr:hypothetical protein JMJ35_006836 [Cladonia borealis]
MELSAPALCSSSVHLLDSLKRDTIFCRLQIYLSHQPSSKCSTLPMSSSNMSFYPSPAESSDQPASIYNIPSPAESSDQHTSLYDTQQDHHKRKREESTEETPAKRPRTTWRNSWPNHWYNAEGKIPCQARGCGKVFDDDRNGDQKRVSHVTGTRNAEHKIILCMDRQIGCVYCDYRVKNRERRQLFNHEELAHRTCSMSTLTSFINLARRGCIIGDLGTRAAEPIFARMLRNLYQQYPSAPRLLYYRVHRREVNHVEEMVLIRILAPHWTGPDDGTLPGTQLVHPNNFLWHLRPNLSLTTREEQWWLKVWNILREMYRKAVI